MDADAVHVIIEIEKAPYIPTIYIYIYMIYICISQLTRVCDVVREASSFVLAS